MYMYMYMYMCMCMYMYVYTVYCILYTVYCIIVYNIYIDILRVEFQMLGTYIASVWLFSLSTSPSPSSPESWTPADPENLELFSTLKDPE